jgi:hypothetical protein
MKKKAPGSRPTSPGRQPFPTTAPLATTTPLPATAPLPTTAPLATTAPLPATAPLASNATRRAAAAARRKAKRSPAKTPSKTATPHPIVAPITEPVTPDWVPPGSTLDKERRRLNRERGASSSLSAAADFERAVAKIAARRATAPAGEPVSPHTEHACTQFQRHPAVEAAFDASQGNRDPLSRTEQIAFHMAELEALRDTDDATGWTGFSRRLFLSILAESGKVGEACDATGLVRSGAYALRNRDPVFAAGWDAAAALARAPLADRLAEQAIDGITDTVTRADGSTATRHRFDGRLSIAVLNRLDRRCDRAESAGACTFGIQANWEAYLVAVGTGDHAAAMAMIAPPEPETAPPPETAPDPQPETAPAKNSPVRPHCPNSDEADITKLPTSELLRRMKAIRDGSFDEDGQPGDEDESLDLSERVWTDDNGDTYTDFAPPAGFAGWQDGAWGDPDYNRSLNSGETAAYATVKAEWAAEDEAEIAGRRGHDAGLRDFFFGFGEEAGGEEAGGKPASDPDGS